MNYKDYIEMANGLNLKSTKDLEEYANKLMNVGISTYNIYYYVELEIALEELGLSVGRVYSAIKLLCSKEVLIEKFGECDAIDEYINVFNKCVELNLDHHYFDGACNYTHNRYVLEMGNDELKRFPTLYSISTFSENYNCSIEIDNYNNYKEKFVHLTDFGISGVKMVTKLLQSKVDSALKYRETMKWKGEMNINAIVDMVKPLFPNLDISVREGKRGCDTNTPNYKAIVVCEGKSQLGSMTLNVDYRGIACLSCRVPLCGESSCDVTNDSVLNAIRDSIKFMLS